MFIRTLPWQRDLWFCIFLYRPAWLGRLSMLSHVISTSSLYERLLLKCFNTYTVGDRDQDLSTTAHSFGLCSWLLIPLQVLSVCHYISPVLNSSQVSADGVHPREWGAPRLSLLPRQSTFQNSLLPSRILFTHPLYMSEPLQPSFSQLFFNGNLTRQFQNVLISHLVQQGEPQNVLQTPHLEHLHLPCVVLTHRPGLWAIEKDGHHQWLKHSYLGCCAEVLGSKDLVSPNLANSSSFL